MYILNTNSVLNFLNGTLPENGKVFLKKVVDDESILSIITKIETLGFKFDSLKEQKKFEMFIEYSKVLNINEAIAQKAILIRRQKKLIYQMLLLLLLPS